MKGDSTVNTRTNPPPPLSLNNCRRFSVRPLDWALFKQASFSGSHHPAPPRPPRITDHPQRLALFCPCWPGGIREGGCWGTGGVDSINTCHLIQCRPVARSKWQRRLLLVKVKEAASSPEGRMKSCIYIPHEAVNTLSTADSPDAEKHMVGFISSRKKFFLPPVQLGCRTEIYII